MKEIVIEWATVHSTHLLHSRPSKVALSGCEATRFGGRAESCSRKAASPAIDRGNGNEDARRDKRVSRELCLHYPI